MVQSFAAMINPNKKGYEREVSRGSEALRVSVVTLSLPFTSAEASSQDACCVRAADAVSERGG